MLDAAQYAVMVNAFQTQIHAKIGLNMYFGTLFILPRLSTNTPQEDPTLLFSLPMLTPMISAI
jgi:hypothetical protein